MMDQAFLARLYMLTSSLKRDKKEKDMSRSALIIQRSIQRHGTIIIMVHLLGCTVSTSTGMDPSEAFYSEVNDRHGLSTAWAPCVHSAWHTYHPAVCAGAALQVTQQRAQRQVFQLLLAAALCK
ncbi:unnamed protein product [Urochloa humidicola]